MKNLFIFFIGLFLPTSLYASTDSLWKLYYQNDRQTLIAQKLLQVYAQQNQWHQRDSTLIVMLGAEPGSDYIKLNALYESYFHDQNFADKKFSINQAQEWLRLNELNKNALNTYNALHNLTKLLFYFKEYEGICKIVDKKYHYASLLKNKIFIIQSLFDKGRCFELDNKKTEAFRKYLDAYYFSVEINNQELVAQSLRTISDFFASNKLYVKARNYKEKELALFLKNNHHCDSNHYFTLLAELSDHLYDNHQEQEAKIHAQKVLDYCIRKGNRKLLISQLTIIRSNFFENNNFDGLIDLYMSRFPAELDSLKSNNKVAYYRIRSLIEEQKGQKQNAIMYLDSADYWIQQSQEPFQISNFYNRKAEFFLRQNMPQEAIICLNKSYPVALSTKYYPFLKIISQNLDTAHLLLGQYQQAHYYRGLSMAYADSLRHMIDDDQIVVLEVENVEKQKELLLRQQEALIDRKHNLQYMLIVILIVTSFIALIVVGSIKIPPIVIRALGYFVFIFFFEFIVLLADHKIHHATHGEPLKIMGLKIILIGILLPLHHWVEEKVVHYLLHHRILQNIKIGAWLKKIFTKPVKPTVTIQESEE